MSTRYTNVYWHRVCTISIRCRRSMSSTRGTSSAWGVGGEGEPGEGAAPRGRGRRALPGDPGCRPAGGQPLGASESPAEKPEHVCAESPGRPRGAGPLPARPRARPPLPRPQRSKHLVVLQAGDHDLRQNDDAGPSHAGTAVDQQRGVGASGFTRAVCMASNRLDLFEVCCETRRTQTQRHGGPAGRPHRWGGAADAGHREPVQAQLLAGSRPRRAPASACAPATRETPQGPELPAAE